MKKQIIFAVLAVAILLSLAACGGTPSNSQTNDPSNGQTSTPTSNEQTSAPTSEPTSTAPEVDTGYKITDYYNPDGSFSALGLALNEEDGEKALTVKSGDILTVGDQRYEVTAETLTLPFYTQPSLDEVIAWWTDHCASLADNGRITELS
jgi:predicted small lipoprotein YifL